MMLMNRISNRRGTAALIALAGLASGASAQPVNTRLEYQVSTDGSTWTNSINVLPGETVQVRTLISYVGPGTAAGLGQLIFQPVVTNWHSTDALPNSMGQTTFEPVGSVRDIPPYGTELRSYPEPGAWGRIAAFRTLAPLTQLVYLRTFEGTGTAAGLLRIARNSVTNWIGEGPTSGANSGNNWSGLGGIPLQQSTVPPRDPNAPAFLTQSQNIDAFGFVVHLDESPETRTLSVRTPAAGIGRNTTPGANYGQQDVRWFTSTTAGSPTLVGSAEVIDAHINVIPSSTAGAVFAMLGLSASRRRTRVVGG
ncbi:MAG: hypothetical protein WC718_05620 [Phycisphaerales bacterium]|jgi:hypothetical protein